MYLQTAIAREREKVHVHLQTQPPSSSTPESVRRSRLVLALLGALDLGDTAELLGAVLPLLACRQIYTLAQSPWFIPAMHHHHTIQSRGIKEHTLLSASLLDLGSGANTDETVVRFELLQGLGGVVDEGEAGALATTELRTETEDGDLVLGGAVEAGELLAEFVLGDVGAVGVEDITDYQN